MKLYALSTMASPDLRKVTVDMKEHMFLSDHDQRLSAMFIEQGYVVVDVDDTDALKRIQHRTASLAAEYLNQSPPSDATVYLDRIHEHVGPDTLNGLRLHVINGLNNETWIRPSYFALARSALDCLVGNELAMQRRVNLSIQLPHDSSSLLPIHADVWDGDSPFEVVVWLPLVNCFETKAMYLVNPEDDRALQQHFTDFADKSAEDIYQAVRGKAHFIPVQFGQVMVFSQTLMHGNRINTIDQTRWSINARFKSALSPYADKRLGEFFAPITLRAATKIGMNYQYNEGFEDA